MENPEARAARARAGNSEVIIPPLNAEKEDLVGNFRAGDPPNAGLLGRFDSINFSFLFPRETPFLIKTKPRLGHAAACSLPR
ncbi:hypothetical protein PG994_003898 [Apiospora phragmitis]|uniref:Uncharacterized protein n=1 Tax=Apiospora phragmitis TaxID=2905665 RepID=A0ABR1W211_9PEZI